MKSFARASWHAASAAYLVLLLTSPAIAATHDPVARGKYIFGAAGGCGCHTEKDRQVNSGGRRYDGPFGTVYSTNITPDRRPQTLAVGEWLALCEALGPLP